MAVGKVPNRDCFPHDVQQAVKAVREAQKLQQVPWAGKQVKACYIQNCTQLTDARIVKDTACSAAEICRYVLLAQ